MCFFSRTKKAETEVETASPPPYNNSQPSKDKAHELERHWDRATRVSYRCGKQCKRPTCCKTTIVIHYRPNFNFKRLFSLPKWFATLTISTRNVPKAMRQGITWSANNITTDGDRIILDNNKYLDLYKECIGKTTYGQEIKVNCLYSSVRRFDLQDTNPEPQWHGSLFVYGRKPFVVINFDIGAITQDLASRGLAWDWQGQPVFSTHGGPEKSFNTIFPGLMRWVWPNPKQGTLAGGVVAMNANEMAGGDQTNGKAK